MLMCANICDVSDSATPNGISVTFILFFYFRHAVTFTISDLGIYVNVVQFPLHIALCMQAVYQYARGLPYSLRQTLPHSVCVFCMQAVYQYARGLPKSL